MYHENIQEVINKYSYTVYIVKLNKEIKCSCRDHGSNQPNPRCPICLGTGYKIKIYPLVGASQTSTIPATFRQESELLITMNFYFLENRLVERDDILVDRDKIYNVYQVSKHTGFHGRPCYSKLSCIPKKLDSKIFMQNFNRIVGGYDRKQ